MVRPAGPGPDAARRRFPEVGRSVAHARQRHAARAADARRHAAERGTDGVRARARQYQIRGHLAERLQAPSRRSATPIGARTSSSPRSATSCAIRWRRSSTAWRSCKLSGALRRRRRTPQACAVMERQVHHLNRLVDDLLEVSRITRGMIEVQKEPLDLTAIVQAAIETSRPVARQAAPRADASTRRRSRSTSPAMPVRLTQVFANLLNNAAKYTNHGGHIPLTTGADDGEAIGQRQGQRHRHRAERCWRRCSTCSCRSIARRGGRRAASASA